MPYDYKTGKYTTRWDDMLAGAHGATTATAPKPAAADPFKTSEDMMRTQAGAIESEENRRYQQGFGLANQAYSDLRSTLASTVDPSLMFSKAADAIGARSSANLEALRGSLGARGLSPNSGAASGLLQRLAFQQGNSVMGAIKDTELESQRMRQVNAATQFGAALNLAGYANSPVPQIGLDTTQNIYEGQLAKYGIDKQAKSVKNANKTSPWDAVLGIAKTAIPFL